MCRSWPEAIALAILMSPTLGAETLVTWDFTRGLEGWEPNFDVANVRTGAAGLQFDSTGIDPWLTSPAVNPPAGRSLRFTLRMASRANSSGQLFYGRSFSEPDSVRFAVVADGAWREYAVTVPPLGSGIRFRLDPASAAGAISIAWARLEALPAIAPPSLVAPRRPVRGALAPLSLASGPLAVVHYRDHFGGFIVTVDGVEVASSHDAEKFGVVDGTAVAWRDLGALPVTVTGTAASMVEETGFIDGAGGRWTLRRSFVPGNVEGTIDVTAEAACDQAREVAHISWITLFPGLGTYGVDMHQGLLAGLEYLEDEPSSSEADLTVPEHVRRVPDPGKITFPLMALERAGRWIGLSWTTSDLAAAVFDTPDRVFSSGAHLLALWAPNVGALRAENSLWAAAPFAIEAGKTASARMTILGGSGTSVVPAVRLHVDARGLPATPSYAGGLQGAIRLLAGGWLDSDCHAGGGLWRHAVWPGFDPQPATDAIVFMGWLANHTTDAVLAGRLRTEASTALAARRTDDPTFATGISHVQWPIGSLLFGNVTGYLAGRRSSAQGQTGKFDAEGVLHYPQPGEDPKYGTTHFADHANGHAARRLSSILEAAQLTGNASLISAALRLLDQQTALYADTVPRGAQTWEIPLHTPDILASAYLVKCCVIGYEISGKAEYLEAARYWAWTGVPFVYLDPWKKGGTGAYATIPVLGATNWVAPVWIGRPVQWCGLVYRSWIARLALHDPDGPWQRISGGITATGLRMSWPAEDAARQGLLPDFFFLGTQVRDGPAINPGTVEASLPELYGAGSLYGTRRAAALGWLVHAPAAIRNFRDTGSSVSFAVGGWGTDPYRVLLSRVSARPQRVHSRPEGSGEFAPATFTHDAANGWLVVDGTGDREFLIAGRNNAPSVSIAAPADGSTLPAGTPTVIRAEAADPDGGVASVEFLVDGAVLSVDRSAPYETEWMPAAGAHAITVRATDDLGATATTAIGVTASAGTAFIRADANSSGDVDLSDGIRILGFLFLGAPGPECRTATDVNRDGQVDVSDARFLLDFLFLGGRAIPAPFPACGIDPSSSALGCRAHTPCGG